MMDATTYCAHKDMNFKMGSPKKALNIIVYCMKNTVETLIKLIEPDALRAEAQKLSEMLEKVEHFDENKCTQILNNLDNWFQFPFHKKDDDEHCYVKIRLWKHAKQLLEGFIHLRTGVFDYTVRTAAEDYLEVVDSYYWNKTWVENEAEDIHRDYKEDIYMYSGLVAEDMIAIVQELKQQLPHEKIAP